MNSLLTRTTAPMAIRFMALCFKRGVIEGSELGNDIDAKEFYDEKSMDWSFGTLLHPEYTDWKAFRSQMYWWAREYRMKTLAESYLFRIRNKNYTWCILPYCMRFYLLGVKEWLDYPNPGRIELFKQSGNVHWDPNAPIKSITRMDIISYLHTFEFDFRRLEQGVLEISEASMSSFIHALYDLSRKYVTGTTEEEDI